MVKTLLATGALVVAVVAGGTYYLSDGFCCPLSGLCSRAPAEDADTDAEPTPGNETTPVTSPGDGCCEASCCGTPSKAALLQASTPATPAATEITVEGMDCPSCAGRLVAKLNAVAGVAKAEADLKTSKLRIAARERATVSPRALWDTVATSGFTPTRLEGPAGTFTARPRD